MIRYTKDISKFKNKSYNKLLGIFFLLLLLFMGSSIIYADTKVDYESIDEYFKKQQINANFPCISIEIVDENEVLFKKAYGNFKNQDLSFGIGSLSKSFTAVAIMQLVEDGKIQLDSDVSKYLDDTNIKNITIKQLLNHSSGITTYSTIQNYTLSSNKSYNYANANYGLLGKIIEKVTGVSYSEYIQKNIFDKLGMTSSFTSFEEANKSGNLINGHQNYFGFNIKMENDYPRKNSTGWSTIPAGYLVSNTSDMGKYLQMYLNNGANILSKTSIEKMFYENVDRGNNKRYGMGWQLDKSYKKEVVEHSGLIETFSTYMLVIPEDKIGAIVMVNTNDYLVSNNVMDDISKDLKKMLTENCSIEVKSLPYAVYHIALDILYILIIVLSLLPLITIKKWYTKVKESNKKYIVSSIIIHFIAPTSVILVPYIIGIPWFIIKNFVNDLYLVLISLISILYLTGIIKVALRLRVTCLYRKEE